MRTTPEQQAHDISQQYKAHVAGKIRKEWGSSVPADATDDDVMGVWGDLNVPKDATQDDINSVIDDTYGKDFVPKPLEDKRTFMEKGQDVAGAVGGAVAPLGANIAANFLPKIAGAASVPAELGMAGYYGTKLAGEALAGHSLEKTAAGIPEPNIAEMRAKGYSEQQIRNVVKGYTDTQQSLMHDIGQTGAEGVHTAEEGLANAAVLPMGAAAAEKVIGGVAGKAAAKAGLKAGLGQIVSKAAERATGGALIGGTFGGVESVADRAAKAVQEGHGADTVLGHMTNGLLGPTESNALGAIAGQPSETAGAFTKGFGDSWKFGAMLGGGFGAVEGGAQVGKAVSAARTARAAESMRTARLVSVQKFADDFKPEMLLDRFKDDTTEGIAQGQNNVQIATNIVSKLHPDVASTDEGMRTIATVAEKMAPWRAWYEKNVAPVVSPPLLPTRQGINSDASVSAGEGFNDYLQHGQFGPDTVIPAPAPAGFEPTRADATAAPNEPPTIQNVGSYAQVPTPGAGDPNLPPAVQGQHSALEPTPQFMPPVGKVNPAEGLAARQNPQPAPPVRPEPSLEARPALPTNVERQPGLVAPPGGWPQGQAPEGGNLLPPSVQPTAPEHEQKPFTAPSGVAKLPTLVPRYRMPADDAVDAIKALGVPVDAQTSEATGRVTIAPQQGTTTEVLQSVLRAADQRGVATDIVVKPHEAAQGGTIPVEKLRPWYEQHGFKAVHEADGAVHMVREAPQYTQQEIPQALKTDAVNAVDTGISGVSEDLQKPATPPGPGRYHQADLFADTNIAAAKERMANRKGRLNAFVDPSDLADLSVIGANYMLKGSLKFADWSENMVKEFGEAVRPHLNRLYQEAVLLYHSRRPLGDDNARRVGLDYIEKTGLGAGKVPGYAPLNEALNTKIAQAYDKLPVEPKGKTARLAAVNAYDAMNQEVEAQFQAMKDAGVDVQFVDENPYPSSGEMRMDVMKGKLKVYKTKADQAHPYLTPEQNDKFRAVHDYFAHAAEGYEFGPRGEDNAWRKHASMFSNAAIPAVTTETRGQNSWVNFMPGHQDLASRDRPFAEQKFGLLPDWTYEDLIRARTIRGVSPRLAVGGTGGVKASTEKIATTFKTRPATSPVTQHARAVADGTMGVPEHLGSMPESANWYAKSIDQMEQKTAEEYPEMKDKPGNMGLFKVMLAITSPQTPVLANYARATMLYDGFRKTGDLPLLGRAGQEVNITSRGVIPKVNGLLKKFDGDTDALTTWLKDKDPKGSYNAVNVLGKKVGRFYLNMEGINDETTVDVWMSRWFRRLNGQLKFDDEGKDTKLLMPEHKAIIKAVEEISHKLGLPESTVQASIWDREKKIWTKAGYPTDNIDFSKAADMVIARRNENAAQVGQKLDTPDLFNQ